MGTLTTELSKLINNWENLNVHTSSTTMTPSAPTSYTQMIFDFVKANPKFTRAEVAHIVVKKLGIKETTTTALVSQMLRAGLFAEHGGYLCAAVDKYDPKRMTEMARAARHAREKAKADKRAAVRGARRVAKEVQVETVAIAAPPTAVTIQDMLNRMSIVQARQVYDELKRIFGG